MGKKVNKILILSIKFYPILISLVLCLDNILHYLDIRLVFLDYCVFQTLSPILLMYLLSYVFSFCRYHRVFIHYMFIEWFLSYYDDSFQVPLSDKYFMYLQMIIFCISLFVALYLYMYDKGNKRIVSNYNSKHRCRQ